MKKFKCQVICHLFYEDESLGLLNKLSTLSNTTTVFLFNIHPFNAARERIESYIKNKFSYYYIMLLPAKGRDIGAKLQLINLSMQLGLESDYTLIVHDKKSPHIENAGSWRKELLKIFETRFIDRALNTFKSDDKTGIVASANYIQNEYSYSTKKFNCASDIKIRELLKKYTIRTDDYRFVAGNIFWIRSSILQQFFTYHSIPAIRAELEPGNVLDFTKGTYVHAWERIFSWIATSQGYGIYGI